jgi:hypothetical protein
MNMISSAKEYFHNRREKQRELMQKKNLLNQLETLYSIKEVRTGFKSQQDSIAWANKVAPLLKFNDQYYMNFVERSHRLNYMGISGQLGGSLLNIMISQIEMAIYDLKQDINHLESK